METNKIVPSIPGRRMQLRLLSSLLGKKGCVALPSLFVYGHTATGKSTVVRHVIEALEHILVSVSCIECYTSRLLYETILAQLSAALIYGHRTVQPSTCATGGTARCDNMAEFVNQLRVLFDAGMTDASHHCCVYILLENSERLRDSDANLLPAFLRIQELSGLNIGVILESEIVWEKFRGGTGFCEPIVVHFADYTKEELLDIMCLDAPSCYPFSVYRTFADILLSVFHIVCHNLNELRYQASVNFKKYIEPVEKGEVAMDNTHKLWRIIEPQLKRALHSVYLRESSCQNSSEQTANARQMTPAVAARPSVELPVYSKYLLIAAYLASYNPAKSDKRFFVKLSGRTKKRPVSTTKKNPERTTNQVLGPKYFPLDRLMAIFYSIIDEKVAPSANIFCQLSSLVTLGLLAQVGGADAFDCPKYKCLVSLELIKSISRSVNFEVLRYIYDFV